MLSVDPTTHAQDYSVFPSDNSFDLAAHGIRYAVTGTGIRLAFRPLSWQPPSRRGNSRARLAFTVEDARHGPLGTC
jgi:hypothetical protein